MLAEFDGDFSPFQKCPVCRAELGEPCTVRSGRVVDGHAVGPVINANRPHIARKRRAGR